MNDLIKVRAVSFFYGFVSLVGLAITGVLLSPEFSALVKDNFGNSALTGFLLLVIPEMVKHVRNKIEIKKLGSEDKKIFLI